MLFISLQLEKGLFVLSVKFRFNAMFIVIVQVLRGYCQFMDVADVRVL